MASCGLLQRLLLVQRHAQRLPPLLLRHVSHAAFLRSLVSFPQEPLYNKEAPWKPLTKAAETSEAVASDEGAMRLAEMQCMGDVADAFMEALLCFGAKSCTLEDANSGSILEEELFSSGPVPWHDGPRRLWHQSLVKALFPADEDIARAVAVAAEIVGLSKPPDFSIAEVVDQDWVLHIQNTHKPIQLAPEFWIVPSWCSPPDPSAISVVLEPGLAFGTGEHPTTRLCLRWLLETLQGGELVLDYGCGSGVLSLAALKIGARRTVGVDIDPLALRSSAYNASLNGFGKESYQSFLAKLNGPDPVPSGAAVNAIPDEDLDSGGSSNGHYSGKGEFDVVVANILLNPLCALADTIAGHARPGGQVALSGILEEQVDTVCSAYSGYLDVMRVTAEDGWACVHGRRKVEETVSQ